MDRESHAGKVDFSTDEADGSEEVERIESDPPPQRFDQLIERILTLEEIGLSTDDSAVNPRSSGPQPKSGLDHDPLERVRDLFEERFPEPTSGRDSTPRGEGVRGRRIPLIALLAGLMLSGIGVASVGHLDDAVLGQDPATYVEADDTLYVSADDASYLNRIFAERSHEVAYCGLISKETDTPQLEIWMADTVQASPGTIEFLTDNCPGQVRDVLLHTHPSGSLELSERDKQTLADRPERFSCVQGGPLRTEPGVPVDNLACYLELPSPDDQLDLARIQVRVLPTGS